MDEINLYGKYTIIVLGKYVNDYDAIKTFYDNPRVSVMTYTISSPYHGSKSDPIATVVNYIEAAKRCLDWENASASPRTKATKVALIKDTEGLTSLLEQRQIPYYYAIYSKPTMEKMAKRQRDTYNAALADGVYDLYPRQYAFEAYINSLSYQSALERLDTEYRTKIVLDDDISRWLGDHIKGPEKPMSIDEFRKLADMDAVIRRLTDTRNNFSWYRSKNAGALFLDLMIHGESSPTMLPPELSDDIENLIGYHHNELIDRFHRAMAGDVAADRSQMSDLDAWRTMANETMKDIDFIRKAIVSTSATTITIEVKGIGRRTLDRAMEDRFVELLDTMRSNLEDEYRASFEKEDST